VAGEQDDVEQDAEVGTGQAGEDTTGPDDTEGVELEGGDAAEHPDDAEDDGQQEQVDGEPARKPSRGEARFQRLANETKAAREEAAATKRELQELRRITQQGNQQLTAEQEAARLAVMTPEERTEYRLAQMQRTMQGTLQQNALQTQLTMDQVAFDAKAAANPVYGKYKAEVEAKFNELLQAGRPTDRETILKFILGERALAGAGNRKPAQQGQRRIAAQQTRPGSGKGDAASQRGKTPDSPEKRLAGQFI